MIPTQPPAASQPGNRGSGARNLRDSMAANDAGKQKMAAVNYRDAESEQTSCGNCSSFQAPNQCALVHGDIQPTGTCDLFTPIGEQEGGPPPGQLAADATALAGGI